MNFGASPLRGAGCFGGSVAAVRAEDFPPLPAATRLRRPLHPLARLSVSKQSFWILQQSGRGEPESTLSNDELIEISNGDNFYSGNKQRRKIPSLCNQTGSIFILFMPAACLINTAPKPSP